MDRFNTAANTVGACVVDLAEWLCGCGHRQTTFPITLRAGAKIDGELDAPSDTYIVCLECGRRFAYDWTRMRIARRRIAWAAAPAPLPALGEASRGPQ